MKLLLHPRFFMPVVLALFPMLFMGFLAGDAVIHLVFAENALKGDWFAFNAGEVSGGETSPGYMLLVMGLMKLVGQTYAPYAMVGLGYAAWLALLVVWFGLVRNMYPAAPLLAWAMVGAVGLMPGSALNSVLGMENVLLAVGVAGVFAWMFRTKALERRLHLRHELVLAGMLGFLTWIRPEAVLLAAVVIGVRWLMLASWRDWAWQLLHAAAMGAVVLGFYGALIVAVWGVSGALPFSGGLARLQLAMGDAWMLGPVPVHPKMLMRWLAYAPLAVAFAVGVGVVWSESALPHRRLVVMAAAVVGVFAVLFSSILPAAHLARYTVFYWPLVVLVGWVGVWRATRLLEARVQQIVVVMVGVMLLGVYGTELYYRKGMAPGHVLADVATAAERRPAMTEALLAELGGPTKTPVSVGLVEVQMRYWYDDQIVVRSLDGIVDRTFSQFANHGRFDYAGYLKARKVDYMLDYLNLNRYQDGWNPEMLVPLGVGDKMLHEGIVFERMGGRVTKLTYGE
ncbi:MAG: hypothetical protein WAZ18_00185 [Alphaproteobacteria bacterium]